MDKDTLIGGIFMVIIVGIFIGAIVYEDYNKSKAICTMTALHYNMSVDETKLLCGLK